MIADASLFRDAQVFRCPRRYWFVEDLWLCYVAQHLAGFDLFKSPAQFEIAEDGCDQYLSLGHTKWRFLRYLIRHGWELVQHNAGDDDLAAQIPAAVAGEAAGAYLPGSLSGPRSTGALTGSRETEDGSECIGAAGPGMPRGEGPAPLGSS